MTIKGAQARAILAEMISQLGDAIPAGLEVKVRGTGARCWLTASKGLPYLAAPGEREYDRPHERIPLRQDKDGRELVLPDSGSLSGTVGAYGTWIPFLPRTLARKLALINMLETVQMTIAGANHAPWPAPGLEVKATSEHGQVRLWFEGEDGSTQTAVVIADSLGQT